MSTLDEISKEKQRVGEALARVDAQRDKPIGELGELEAAERVLARYSKGTRAGKTAAANGPTTSTTAPAQSRGRPRAQSLFCHESARRQDLDAKNMPLPGACISLAIGGRAEEAFSGRADAQNSIQRQGVTPPPSVWHTGGK